MQGYRGLSFAGHAARKGPPGHVIGQGSPNTTRERQANPVTRVLRFPHVLHKRQDLS